MNRLIALYISIILVANTVIAEDHHKRAPSGFTGVRGKKSVSNSVYDSIVEDSEGPDILLKPEDYSVAVSDGDDGVVEKRAPSGFMEIRDIKRFPSGFMGMRGKKELDQPYLRTSYSDKRTPTGFFGVRGKKDYDYSLASDDKRAPSGFFGMRGKKRPSGFFGVRGKKYPYEFRGKFVGVRGKKMSNEITGPDIYADLDLERLREKLNINQLMLLLTEQNEADNRSWPWNENSDGLFKQ